MGEISVRAAVTIRRPRADVYAFWRDFENLPSFMIHLESVQPTGDRHSHWVATAPAGRIVEWDAEIVDERPDELIAWRSLAGSNVANEGAVRFVDAPREQGTEIHVELRYDAPAGQWIAEADGRPRAYRSTDNVVDPAWTGRAPGDVMSERTRPIANRTPTPIAKTTARDESWRGSVTDGITRHLESRR